MRKSIEQRIKSQENKNEQLKENLKPSKYDFMGLSYEQVVELQDAALKLANVSADIYAYCLRALEKENEALKEKLSLMEQKNNG